MTTTNKKPLPLLKVLSIALLTSNLVSLNLSAYASVPISGNFTTDNEAADIQKYVGNDIYQEGIDIFNSAYDTNGEDTSDALDKQFRFLNDKKFEIDAAKAAAAAAQAPTPSEGLGINQQQAVEDSAAAQAAADAAAKQIQDGAQVVNETPAATTGGSFSSYLPDLLLPKLPTWLGGSSGEKPAQEGGAGAGAATAGTHTAKDPKLATQPVVDPAANPAPVVNSPANPVESLEQAEKDIRATGDVTDPSVTTNSSTPTDTTSSTLQTELPVGNKSNNLESETSSQPAATGGSGGFTPPGSGWTAIYNSGGKNIAEVSERIKIVQTHFPDVIRKAQDEAHAHAPVLARTILTFTTNSSPEEIKSMDTKYQEAIEKYTIERIKVGLEGTMNPEFSRDIEATYNDTQNRLNNESHIAPTLPASESGKGGVEVSNAAGLFNDSIDRAHASIDGIVKEQEFQDLINMIWNHLFKVDGFMEKHIAVLKKMQESTTITDANNAYIEANNTLLGQLSTASDDLNK